MQVCAEIYFFRWRCTHGYTQCLGKELVIYLASTILPINPCTLLNTLKFFLDICYLNAIQIHLLGSQQRTVLLKSKHLKKISCVIDKCVTLHTLLLHWNFTIAAAPHSLPSSLYMDALFHSSSLYVFSYAPNTSCHHISIAFFDPYQDSTLVELVFCMSTITINKTCIALHMYCITLHYYNFKGLPS